MHRARKQRKIVIYSLIGIIILMTAAYAAFSQSIDIKGTTKVTSNWNVKITNVSNGTPTGNAQNSKDESGNTINPTWDKLSANVSADLYESGDSMEYIVTITNNGSIDATLDDVILTPSNNSAVLITYSGYAKGQKLYKKGSSNSSVDIKVKIEYNPDYSGEEVTGESSISFNFVQSETKEVTNDTVISKDSYKLTYNCEENGGTGSQEAMFDVGKNVDLSVKCEKKGNYFLGWNTDKNATNVVNNYTMPNENKTLYGIYTLENITLSLATTSTTNTITVTASASAISGIKKYTYTLNGESVKCKSETEDNICIIENLNQNTTYNIGVTVTSNINNTFSASKSPSTKTLNVPTYISTKNQTTINYPTLTLDNGNTINCSNGLTCKYKKDSGSEITVTSTTSPTVTFDKAENITATVSYETTTVSSTYTFAPKAENLSYVDTNTNLGCTDAQCALEKIKELLE